MAASYDLTRALALKPRVLIINEPTANVDSETAETILTVLRDLVGRERAVIMVTHDREALVYTGRSYALVNGKLTEITR
ncbi:MAG: hypothetical protein ACP5GZ_07965 [Vulcanisaeta sp.]|uniref:hypothetical protein n=1 Tax=Vulcanisaeta sp. TaxID=2020871 RepID=UPI003D0F9384